MDDNELTRLAIKLLEKEGERFVRERSLMKPGPLKANKQFLTATLRQNEISNRRINKKLEGIGENDYLKNSESSGSNTVLSLGRKQFGLQDSRTRPLRNHKFNRDVFEHLRNGPSASKLTKDSKVSFKFFSKRDDANKSDKNDTNKVEIPSSECNKVNSKSSDVIINISDNESIISVSSSESVDVEVVKKSKKKKKHKQKKKEKKTRTNSTMNCCD